MKPLQDHEIVSLHTTSERDAPSGILVSRGGAVRQDGTSFDVWDLVLDTAPSREETSTE